MWEKSLFFFLTLLPIAFFGQPPIHSQSTLIVKSLATLENVQGLSEIMLPRFWRDVNSGDPGFVTDELSDSELYANWWLFTTQYTKKEVVKGLGKSQYVAALIKQFQGTNPTPSAIKAQNLHDVTDFKVAIPGLGPFDKYGQQQWEVEYTLTYTSHGKDTSIPCACNVVASFNVFGHPSRILAMKVGAYKIPKT